MFQHGALAVLDMDTLRDPMLQVMPGEERRVEDGGSLTDKDPEPSSPREGRSGVEG